MTMVPPMEPESPHVNTPATLTCCSPAGAATSKLSPGFRSSLSAKLLMMLTSFGRLAPCPATIRAWLNGGPGLVVSSVGAPPVWTVLPSTIAAPSVWYVPAALATPGTASIRASIVASSVCGVVPELSIVVNAVFGDTCTAVPLNDVLKMSAKPLWIWSVST